MRSETNHAFNRIAILLAVMSTGSWLLVGNLAGAATDEHTPVPSVADEHRPSDETPQTNTTSTEPQTPTSPSTAAQSQLQFPYVAEITAKDVYVRSGPGQNYYACGKLSSPTRVTVYAVQFGWAKIAPPAGSFSWISKKYVSADAEGTEGTLTGDRVRVRAGGVLKPELSTQVQCFLYKGQKVKILGEQDGWYKIVPPQKARLWVSAKFLKPVVEQAAHGGTTAKGNAATTPAVVTTDPAYEIYAKAAAAMRAELKKPLKEQNLQPIVEQFRTVVSQAKSELLKGMAQQQILNLSNRLELIASTKRVERLTETLNQAIAEFEKMRRRIMATGGKAGPLQFVAKGTLLRSPLYQDIRPQRMRLVDDNGKIICYVEPAEGVKLDFFIGRRVGIIGKSAYDKDIRLNIVTAERVIELAAGPQGSSQPVGPQRKPKPSTVPEQRSGKTAEKQQTRQHDTQDD